jgi:lysozyme family protein
LQQQGYPFQVAQFLANIAMGTGALSGQTTTTQQPSSFFSDKRLKEDIEPIGETYDGQKIVKFRYKGEPGKQIGLIAQDVEKRHPEAVGLAGGYKTVDYDKATKHAADKGHYLHGGLVSQSEGGAVYEDRAGQGYAKGGETSVDMAEILALLSPQKTRTPYGKIGLYGQASKAAGPYGSNLGLEDPRGLAVRPVRDLALDDSRYVKAPAFAYGGLAPDGYASGGLPYSEAGGQYVPEEILEQEERKREMLRPNAPRVGAPPQSGAGQIMGGVDSGVKFAENAGKIYDAGKEGYELLSSFFSSGGLVPHMADGGSPDFASLLAMQQAMYGNMPGAKGGAGGLNIPQQMQRKPEMLRPSPMASAPTESGFKQLTGAADSGVKFGDNVARIYDTAARAYKKINGPDEEAAPTTAATGGLVPRHGYALDGTVDDEEVYGPPAPPPTDAERARNDSINRIIGFEGGDKFVEDDAGKGPTRYGINQGANPDVDVRNLTKGQAEQLYQERYWNPLGADNMDPNLARVAFNTAVQSGVGTAKNLLKQSDNDPNKLLDAHQEYLNNLITKNPEKFGQFQTGYNNRINALRGDITPPSASPQTAEQQKQENLDALKKRIEGETLIGTSVVPGLVGANRPQNQEDRIQGQQEALRRAYEESQRTGETVKPIRPDYAVPSIAEKARDALISKTVSGEKIPAENKINVGLSPTQDLGGIDYYNLTPEERAQKYGPSTGLGGANADQPQNVAGLGGANADQPSNVAGQAGAPPTAATQAGGTTPPPPPAPPVKEKPGLLSRVGDTLTSRDFLVPLLSGLGSMASSPSRYLGSAVLQGLAGGAEASEAMRKRSADIAKTEAETMQQNIVLTPYGNLVFTADGSPMLAGEYFKLKKAGNAPQLFSGKMPTSTEAAEIAARSGMQKINAGTTASTTAAGSTAAPAAAAAQSQSPLMRPGTVYDDDSRKKAEDEAVMVMSGGVTGDAAKTNTEAYRKTVTDGAESALQLQPTLTKQAGVLSAIAENTKLGVPGSGFDLRGEVAKLLNTAGNVFNINFGTLSTDAELKDLSQKMTRLQAAILANGGDQRSFAALSGMAEAVANPNMDKKAFAELHAQAMVDGVRALDRDAHKTQWQEDSNGLLVGANQDFQKKNPETKYQFQKEVLKNLMINPDRAGLIKEITSGKYSAAQIDAALVAAYGPKAAGLSRAFTL